MGLFSALWWIVTLPIRLVLLPFKILSFFVTVITYAVVLALIAAATYFVVL